MDRQQRINLLPRRDRHAARRPQLSLLLRRRFHPGQRRYHDNPDFLRDENQSEPDYRVF